MSKAEKAKVFIGFIVKVLSTILLSMMSLSLIGSGWYQEIFWYHSVFTGNGLEDKFSYIAGGALSLLLCHFAIQGHKKAFRGLLMFSILITVIGQNQDYTEKKELYQSQKVREDKKQILYIDYKAKIEGLEDDIKYETSLLPSNIQDRANWDTKGVQPTLTRIDNLKAEKIRYEDKNELIILSESVITEPKTSYDNFSNDLKFIPAIIIRYIILVFTSWFIGLMAPSGFVLMRKIWGIEKIKPVEATIEPDNKLSDKMKKIILFANSRYNNKEYPDTLNSREAITKETGLSQNYFNNINKLALTLGLVELTDNRKTIPIASRSEFISHISKKQSFSSRLVVVG